MRVIPTGFILTLLAFTTPASSNFHGGEIVSMEWIATSFLDVRYSPATKPVTCVAYDDQDRAIASNTGYPVGPVASIVLNVPKPWAGTNKVRVSCD